MDIYRDVAGWRGERSRESVRRFWNVAADAWMIAVLLLFWLIRVAESREAHRLLLWWKAR